jgi:hypothetical protein
MKESADGTRWLESILFSADSAEYGLKPKATLSGFQFTALKKDTLQYYGFNDQNGYEYAQAVGTDSTGKESEFNFELKKAE